MFKSIKEGFAVYHEALLVFAATATTFGLTGDAKSSKDIWSFQEWLPWRPGKEPNGLSSRDSEQIIRQNLRLRGMAKALGLTPTEVRRAYKAVGLAVKIKR